MTHGTLSGERWRELPAAGARRVVVTDTVPGVRERAAGVIEVLAIAPLLLAALASPTVGEVPPRFNELDLVALSDLAWDVVDPEGDHEAQEQAWTAALHEDWPPIATIGELRARLNEIADAIALPTPDVPLRAVAALTAFLAAHHDRQALEEAALADALHESYPDGLPDDVAAWLAQRRLTPVAHRRGHGGRQPRRHAGTRPAPPEGSAG